MKLYNLIDDFFNKYNKNMIESIDNMSTDPSNKLTRGKMKLFNVNESIDNFNKYLQGYCKYKIDNKDNPEASSQDTIMEAVDKFINDNKPKEVDIKYTDVSDNISKYLENINTTIDNINNVTSSMVENNINNNDIACINKIVDDFTNTFVECIDDNMDRILWASGYNSRQKLKHVKENANVKKEQEIFI